MRDGIFIDEKRDEAIERIARAVVIGSKNCVSIIKKINRISQDPEKHSHFPKIIPEWTETLFTNHIHDSIDDWVSANTISIKHLDVLELSFFNYIISLVPFYYDNIVIVPPNSNQSIKYKWSDDEFLLLKKKVFEERYKEYWNQKLVDNIELSQKIDEESLSSLKILNLSSRVKRTYFWKSQKIKKILSTEGVYNVVINACPTYKYQYQKDVFLKWTKEFINTIPEAFDIYDSNFYQVGTYLQGYFKWCNRNDG